MAIRPGNILHCLGCRKGIAHWLERAEAHSSIKVDSPSPCSNGNRFRQSGLSAMTRKHDEEMALAALPNPSLTHQG